MSTPRTVLLLATEVLADGGIQRFNRTLLAACGALPHRCVVLSLGDRATNPDIANLPVQVRLRGFDRNKLRFAIAAAREILGSKPDVVVVGHVHLLPLVAGLLRLRSSRGRRILLIAHGLEIWRGLKGRRRRALRVVHRVLCVSRYTRERIRAQVPELAEDRFVHFPNALDETWQNASATDAPGSDLRDLPDRFLLSVSRITRQEHAKGLASVIEALPMLDDPSVHYVIAGRGDDRAFLEGVARRCGVSYRVHLVGGVSDSTLAALYRRCLAFVLPSGQEGFGLVFIEAMYFGAPVVAAAEKGAVDVVRHEETGLLVRYGDVAQIRATLDRLLADKELRIGLARRGRALVTGDGEFGFAAFLRRSALALDAQGHT